jgi:beta-lactamase class A
MSSVKLIRWCILLSTTATLIIFSVTHFLPNHPSQASPPIVSLSDRLDTLNLSAAQGQVGIGVMDLKTGKRWFHKGDQRFPMQSVYKLPIGIVVLKLVDAGKLSLNQQVTVSRRDFAPGLNSFLKDIKGNSGQFTVQDLLDRSVGLSDNTAVDVLIRLVGGTEKVTAMLRQINIQGIRVDRLERQVQPDCVGMTNFSSELADEQKYAAAVENIPVTVKRAALERYLSDPRDTATPEEIIDLLAKLQSRQLLQPFPLSFNTVTAFSKPVIQELSMNQTGGNVDDLG